MRDAPKSGEIFMLKNVTKIEADQTGDIVIHYRDPKAASVSRPPEQGPALARSSSGRMVGLRPLAFICGAIGSLAMLENMLGIVGEETLAAALYWPWMTFLGAWAFSKEPNAERRDAYRRSL